MASFRPNRYPGKLIVIEGVDGAGKATQLKLLKRWLESRGIAAFGLPLPVPPAERDSRLTPTALSLFEAAGFAEQHDQHLIPLLKAGAVICAAPYAYSAFARDSVRGVARKWVRQLYRFAILPNLRFYLRLPLELAVDRNLQHHRALTYYQSGMDLGLTSNTEESFRLFQGRVLEEYDQMTAESGFEVIDASLSMEVQQKRIRAVVQRELKSHWRNLIPCRPEASDAAETTTRPS